MKFLKYLKEQSAIFCIYSFHYFMKYFLGYDRMVVYVGDLETQQFTLRRYFIESKVGVVRTSVMGMVDMKYTLPRKDYLRYMHEIKEFSEKESAFYVG